MTALGLEGVTCTFPAPPRGGLRGGGRNAPRGYTAVEDVWLAVGETEFVAVVGPTGCGKSTLLNAMAGLLAPTGGRVTVRGQPLAGINRDAGYMFQADALMPWRTTLENVIAGLQFRGCERAEARRRGREWIDRVGLAAFAHHHPHQLSGGMRKRVAMAQMLVLDPRIILMDEPFSALDVQTRQLMENELLALWAADRRCAVFVTHDLEEAIVLSDRVVVLSAGPNARIIAQFEVKLPRPRDVAEIRLTPEFLELHCRIWDAMRAEVTKAHRQVQGAVP